MSIVDRLKREWVVACGFAKVLLDTLLHDSLVLLRFWSRSLDEALLPWLQEEQFLCPRIYHCVAASSGGCHRRDKRQRQVQAKPGKRATKILEAIPS